jgi:hypothetical protein
VQFRLPTPQRCGSVDARPRPVGTDQPVRGRDEEGEWETETLDAEEDEVGAGRDAALLCTVDVESELDRAGDDGSKLADCESDGNYRAT